MQESEAEHAWNVAAVTASQPNLFWLEAGGFSGRAVAKAIWQAGVMLIIEPGDTAKTEADQLSRAQIQASMRRRSMHYQALQPLGLPHNDELARFEVEFIAKVATHLPCCLISFGAPSPLIERLAERIATAGGLQASRLRLPRRGWGRGTEEAVSA